MDLYETMKMITKQIEANGKKELEKEMVNGEIIPTADAVIIDGEHVKGGVMKEQYRIYVQGVKIIPECAACGVKLTKQQVDTYEINQFTFTCGLSCYEKSL